MHTVTHTTRYVIEKTVRPKADIENRSPDSAAISTDAEFVIKNYPVSFAMVNQASSRIVVNNRPSPVLKNRKEL